MGRQLTPVEVHRHSVHLSDSSGTTVFSRYMRPKMLHPDSFRAPVWIRDRRSGSADSWPVKLKGVSVSVIWLEWDEVLLG